MRGAWMGVAAVLLAVSGTALGQQTALRFEGSLDGGQTWASNLNAAPGATLMVRLRATLSGATALGLAGFTLQPIVHPWRVGHALQAFTFPGLRNNGTAATETAYDGRHVASTPASNTGRLFPYGSVGQGVSSASGLLTAHQDAGNRLRLAGSRATTASFELWGVQFAQVHPEQSGTVFNASLDAVVFRYAVTLDPGGFSSTTFGGIGLHNAAVRWYLSADGVSHFSTPAVIQPLLVVPGPGAMALVGVVGVAAMRRRR